MHPALFSIQNHHSLQLLKAYFVQTLSSVSTKEPLTHLTYPFSFIITVTTIIFSQVIGGRKAEAHFYEDSHDSDRLIFKYKQHINF